MTSLLVHGIKIIYYIYCDEPLLRNGRLSTEVISMVTNTENHPITRNG
jgi:hypothetical protein